MGWLRQVQERPLARVEGREVAEVQRAGSNSRMLSDALQRRRRRRRRRQQRQRHRRRSIEACQEEGSSGGQGRVEQVVVGGSQRRVPEKKKATSIVKLDKGSQWPNWTNVSSF